MRAPTFLGAFVLLTVSLIAQGAPMPQDIPLQKPKLLQDRENQERSIRMGREPFKTHAIAEPKSDDANEELRIAMVGAANLTGGHDKLFSTIFNAPAPQLMK